jgi:lysine-specific demethylase 8
MASQEPCHKKRKIDQKDQEASSSKDTTQDQVDAIVESFLGELDIANDASLAGCGPAPLSIITTQPQAVLDLAHGKMHTFPYHAVPTHWRRLYEDASCHLALSMLQSKPFSA